MESGNSSTAFEALQASNALLEKRASLAEERVAQLEHELAQLKRLVFGVKSERFEGIAGEDQLPLFELGEQQALRTARKATEAMTVRKPKRRPHRQVLPAHLPREVIVIEPEGDSSSLKKIGDEVTETLDYRPARLVVIRRERPKYVDPTNEDRGVIIGSLPPRPIEKGIAEPGLLAHMLISKFVDHLPYYRQVEQFRREGVTFAESTIGDWGRMSAELLVPLYERLALEVKQSGYIQADETPIAVKDRSKKKKTHRGYYWVYLAPTEGLVCMDYQEGRSREGPTQFLDGFTGALQSDGYTAYDDFDRQKAITCYNCWAHARRHFFEAQDNEPVLAVDVLKQIGRLYDIERELRDGEANGQTRRLLRQEKAIPILEDLKAFLEANRGLPLSPWGKAVAYSLKRWKKLTRYTEDGRIEIDSNLVENAIRPIALGRKNYLFSGSHAAAQRAAVIYSLLATCKRHDVNPQVWLSDVLSRIATHPIKQIDELLPHRWENSKR